MAAINNALVRYSTRFASSVGRYRTRAAVYRGRVVRRKRRRTVPGTRARGPRPLENLRTRYERESKHPGTRLNIYRVCSEAAATVAAAVVFAEHNVLRRRFAAYITCATRSLCRYIPKALASARARAHTHISSRFGTRRPRNVRPGEMNNLFTRPKSRRLHADTDVTYTTCGAVPPGAGGVERQARSTSVWPRNSNTKIRERIDRATENLICVVFWYDANGGGLWICPVTCVSRS